MIKFCVGGGGVTNLNPLQLVEKGPQQVCGPEADLTSVIICDIQDPSEFTSSLQKPSAPFHLVSFQNKNKLYRELLTTDLFVSNISTLVQKNLYLNINLSQQSFSYLLPVSSHINKLFSGGKHQQKL